jgi:hypothetical protein
MRAVTLHLAQGVPCYRRRRKHGSARNLCGDMTLTPRPASKVKGEVGEGEALTQPLPRAGEGQDGTPHIDADRCSRSCRIGHNRGAARALHHATRHGHRDRNTYNLYSNVHAGCRRKTKHGPRTTTAAEGSVLCYSDLRVALGLHYYSGGHSLAPRWPSNTTLASWILHYLSAFHC